MSALSQEAAAVASEVARLFYDGQQSKVRIAARLGISRFRVARLIDQALAEGLVRIEFRDVPAADRERARIIEDRWGLDLCVVIAAGEGGEVVDRVAAAAGPIVGGLIGPGDVVGIAWGSTLARLVAGVPARDDPSLTVVQLAGSSTRLDGGRDAGDLARSLAERLGGAHHRLFAPTFVGSRALRDALLAEPEVATTVAQFGRLDLAIVGIGAIDRPGQMPGSSLLASGVLAADEIDDLLERGAIGDLVVHPFDGAGRFVAPDLAARAIAIDVAGLKSVPRVVAIAAGAHKAAAIRGGLETGIVSVLITDAVTAAAVVADADGKPRPARRHRRRSSRPAR